MKQISVYLATSFAIIALVVGVSIGYVLTPEYSLSMYEKGQMDLGQADKWIDLRYVNAMISHHRGAMLLAKQAEISERAEIKSLAKEILANEPKLIDELYGWKQEWYGDTRAVRDPTVAQLGQYDNTFDRRFLNALIAHHDAGINMTKEVRLKSSRSKVLDNADAVEAFLVKSGAMLSDWRASWYSI